MARKPKKSKRGSSGGWWASLTSRDPKQVARHVFRGLIILLVVGVGGGVVWGVTAANRLVNERLVQTYEPRFVFVDVPDEIWTSAERDLAQAVAPYEQGDWMRHGVCREVAARVAELGWVRTLHSVRRTSGGVFEIRCTYRLPVAMIESDHRPTNGRPVRYCMIDREGVRLPGLYHYSPEHYLIQEVGAAAPEPGRLWPGEDIQAALSVLEVIAREPFAHQITGVLVGNFGGRRDRSYSHIVLSTDRAGGRILWGEAPGPDVNRIQWGSAPGEEVAENTIEQKCAILRANYRDSGRVDDNHPLIDVSTYPDRYYIPG